MKQTVSGERFMPDRTKGHINGTHQSYCTANEKIMESGLGR